MTRRAWSAADTAWLCEHYHDTPAFILRAAFDRPDWQIYNKAFALGLHKTPEYLAGELGGTWPIRSESPPAAIRSTTPRSP